MLRALIVMPLATQRGGSEVVLQQLLEFRRDAGIEPTVAFLQSGPMVDWCRERGVSALVIDAGRLRQARRFGRTVRALVGVARRTQAEVLIGWMAKGQLYGGLAAAAARLPSIWLQPGVPVARDPLDRAATLLPARLIVTPSRGVEAAQRKLWPRRATAVVNPAVDTDRFDAGRIGDVRDTRRRLGLPEDGPIFGSVGRLDPWKGFHVLLDAVPEVAKSQPDATLVLVGGRHEFNPAYADELADQARRLGRDGRVRLVGQQSNPEDWMQAMDVFCHTSANEPFGLVVIEAMALGKPVVASGEGGPTEVITPGVDGLLSPYGDARALAAAIVRLLEDERLRVSLGRAARRRAHDFGVRQAAQRFGLVVAEAVERGRARG
jgi:glycosyltransferase involved in cell wall biosynthesis